MKQILLSILHPNLTKILKDPLTVTIEDDADIVKTIMAADKLFARIHKGPFPIENIYSLLQLLWNFRTESFYEDIGIDARTPEGEWLPLRDTPLIDLPPNSDIKLNPDAGCWWNIWGTRLSKEDLLEELINRFGKASDIVKQYKAYK